MRSATIRGGLGLAARAVLAAETHPESTDGNPVRAFVVPMADTRRARLIAERGVEDGMAEAEKLRHEERAAARAVLHGAFRQRKGGESQ